MVLFWLVLLPLFTVMALNLPVALFRKLALPTGLILTLVQVVAVVAFPPFADGLSRAMWLTIAPVTAAALLTCRATVGEERRRFAAVNLILLAMAGMNGQVLVRDLFSLYVFIEIASLSSFILIALHRDLPGLEGSFKYLVMSALATALMLAATALLFMISGSTGFEAVGDALRRHPGNGLLSLGLALFLCGLLIKSGVVPFHGWLPDAYASGSPPASVLMAGIVTKTTGVYALMRLVSDVIGTSEPIGSLLLAVGALSAVVGALAALGQRDMKRMLAYSSISQVGYIVLGLGTSSPLGFAGALMHLFNHAIFKSLLFVNAAAVERQTGTRDMDRMGGLGSRMPVTGGTAIVAMLATAGVPPLAGFWSKLAIVAALWQGGHTSYAVIAVATSLLTLAYFLSLQRRVFFGTACAGLEEVREAGWELVAPSLVLAGILVGVGLAVPWILGTCLLPIDGL